MPDSERYSIRPRSATSISGGCTSPNSSCRHRITPSHRSHTASATNPKKRSVEHSSASAGTHQRVGERHAVRTITRQLPSQPRVRRGRSLRVASRPDAFTNRTRTVMPFRAAGGGRGHVVRARRSGRGRRHAAHRRGVGHAVTRSSIGCGSRGRGATLAFERRLRRWRTHRRRSRSRRWRRVRRPAGVLRLRHRRWPRLRDRRRPRG
jgi:hypothetical protein